MTSSATYAQAPGALPLVGHLHRLARDPLGFLASLPEYGDLVGVRFGTRRATVVCDPALTLAVLRDDRTYEKGGPFYDRIGELFGNGLVGCPHGEHRRQRRLTQPAFRRDRMPGYAPAMIEQASQMAASWGDGQVVDAERDLT